MKNLKNIQKDNIVWIILDQTKTIYKGKIIDFSRVTYKGKTEDVVLVKTENKYYQVVSKPYNQVFLSEQDAINYLKNQSNKN